MNNSNFNQFSFLSLTINYNGRYFVFVNESRKYNLIISMIPKTPAQASIDVISIPPNGQVVDEHEYDLSTLSFRFSVEKP
jgi:hypothetical protein